MGKLVLFFFSHMYNTDILTMKINYFFNILCAILFQTYVKRAQRFFNRLSLINASGNGGPKHWTETFHIYIRKSLKNPKITITSSHFNVFNEFFMIFYFNKMGMSQNFILKYRESHTGKVLCFVANQICFYFSLGAFSSISRGPLKIGPISIFSTLIRWECPEMSFSNIENHNTGKVLCFG